jgi:protein-S-isoprenylcysteine O-methyltransferase Ste14
VYALVEIPRATDCSINSGRTATLAPGRLLASAGIHEPLMMRWQQLAGLLVLAAGASIALCCVFVFAWLGRGTPAPFDPPRSLVVRGPYRFVRNPMYIGVATALAGAALYFAAWPLLFYAVALVVCAHLFVVLYEEPTLRRSFGADYEAYCRHVHRWLPVRPAGPRPVRS